MISSSQNTGGLSGATSYEHMEQALAQVSSRPAHEETDSSETHSQQRSPKEGLSPSHETERATTTNDSQLQDNMQRFDLLGSTRNSNDRETPNSGGQVTEGEPSPHAARRTTPASSHISTSGTESSENDEPHDPMSSPTSKELGLPQSITLLPEDPNPTPTANDGSKSQGIHSDAESSHSNSPPSSSPTNMPGTNGKSTSPKPGSTLRRGKWTVEEETYVARIIQDFNSGFLNAPAGTTLRSYLSEKLQCDPMRITKKFTGDSCIGKRVFHPAVRSTANAAAIDKAQAELDTLERRWRRRLEMQQRDSAKKAAASAAAANAATGGTRGHTMIQGVPVALLNTAVGQCSTSEDQAEIGQSVVTQAASWLDRANAILRGAQIQGFPMSTLVGFPDQQESIDTLPNSEIENQMKEVQRLIYEGPQIQMTTAGLPDLLASNPRTSSVLDGPPSPPEPVDKRMRTGGTISGAEDAEALVGFLRSVRASAAAGQDAS